jgi:hypothetical protein
MHCPTCKHRAVRANPDDHHGAEWWICPNPNCVQSSWSRGRPGGRGQRSPLVDDLVSLTEEQRERAAHIYVGRLD